MKLKQISFKIISMVMVFAMMFSISATTISAVEWTHDDHTHSNDKDEIYYVSLGDSMTNGYGLPGYDANSGVEDYGNGSYANLFAEWLGKQANVDHTQLAMSAMRAEDIHWILELDYNDLDAVKLTEASSFDEAAWNAAFTTGDYWTWDEICTHSRTRATTDAILATGYTAYPDCYDPATPYVNDVALIAKYFQEAVAKADVISLGMGNGNFGVFMFGRILESLGFNGTPDEAMIYSVENAIRELSPEMQAKVLELKAELDKKVAEYIASDDNTMAAETVDAFVNTVVYTCLSFVLNYAGAVEAILQLNPDAEFILVALMNTFATQNDIDGVSIGDILEVVYTPLNAFIAGLPTYMQITENSAYADATFYYAEASNVECIVDVYGEELNDPASIVRDRFVESIVGTCDHEYCYDADCESYEAGMVWELMIPVIGNLVPGATLMRPDAESLHDYNSFTTEEIVGILNNNMINEVISCALYFAFEDAIVATSASAIDVNAILGLGAGISFDGVMANFGENIAENSASYFAEVLTIVALAQGVTDFATAQYLYENNADMKSAVDSICSVLAIRETLSAALQADPTIASLLSLFARCIIGNGIGSHPSAAGHKTIANAVINAYETGYTTEDKTVENAIVTAEALIAFIEEYYDDAYAYAYAELKANGVIAEVNAALDAAIEAVVAAQAEVEGFDVEAKLEETKALIVKELALTEATLYQIKVLVGYETITEDYLETLKDLLELLEGHLENVGAIATELGGIVLDEAIKAVNAAIAELEMLVKELAEKAYEYILEKAPVIYEQFVNAVVENVKYYSHEAAKACYYWLLNNPETVIEFFETYGDDIVDFIADNYQIIFGVIGFVGVNYGEEIVELVLDNADVIIPAVINWFEIHGDLVWDLIVVYFDAIVAYYDLGIDLDFSTIEGIQASFDKIFGLLGDLVDMIADGVYDYLEALGILENIQNELAKLEAFIRDTIKEHIEALKDYVAEKIEAIKAEIQAQIDALEEALKNAADELKAEIQAQIDALKAKLEALVNAEIENLEDAVEALEKLLKEGVKDLGEYIYGVITEFVDAAVRGEFTPTEDSYYVSVNGGNAYYAELLAEALANNLDVDSIKLGNTVWGNIDYDMLSKADLVTIGYDENELSAFAVEQLLAYIANYADADLRNSTNEYVGNVFAALQNWIDGNKLNLDMGQYENETLAGINGVIDEILAYDLIAGKELTEMNWAEYVGEENLSYVDELRAELKSQLLEAGVIETFTYTVDIVAYIYENAEELGIPATVLAIVPQSTAYEILGENAYYTVEVPVADAIVFAAESYLYGYVEFNVTYGKLIVDLYKINPEATVILLGHYNAYDVEFAIGDVAVDLSEAYGYIAGISSVQPFAYALLSPNVSYVDISDAETVYESYVAEGFADGSLLEFVMMYLADSSITDVSEAGNVYIYEQIMNILTVGCEHVYDNACDAECNKCGEIREVPGHVYDNACDTSCNVCGEKRDVPAHVYVDGVCIYCGAKEKAEHVHEYDSCYDTVCKTCGEIREAEEHAYDDCTDTTCYKCKEVREAPGHEYDNCADTECNNCGYERKALNHVYSNACDADCNVCGESREAAAHVYSGCTDTDCNVCGEKREAGAHVVDDCADNICNVCGQNVATNGHKYGAWTVTVEATRKNAGEKTHTCEKCGKVETKTIAALGGIGGGAIAAIVIGSVVVAGAAGFAIYWFLIQKKTFAALVAAIKGVFGGNAAAGAAAPAAEAATAEAAEAAAEAPAAEAEAPASEEETK